MAFGAKNDAYDEGFNAYHTGKRNPYKGGSTSAIRFANGYSHARLQARAEADSMAALTDTLLAR